jgi:hypothetical protein
VPSTELGTKARDQKPSTAALSISEIASGLKWATELIVDGALEAVNSELRRVNRWS